jgi:hypothetical protein
LAQAITCRAANDRIDRNHIQADIGRAVGPETAEAEIIVDAAIRQNHATILERAVLFESQGLVERRKKERVSRRCGDGVRDRHMVAVELAPAPGTGLHCAETERRASPEFRGVDDEMRLCQQVVQRRTPEQQFVESRFEQRRPAGKAMQRRPDVEALDMRRKRPRRDQACGHQISVSLRCETRMTGTCFRPMSFCGLRTRVSGNYSPAVVGNEGIDNAKPDHRFGNLLDLLFGVRARVALGGAEAVG